MASPLRACPRSNSCAARSAVRRFVLQLGVANRLFRHVDDGGARVGDVPLCGGVSQHRAGQLFVALARSVPGCSPPWSGRAGVPWVLAEVAAVGAVPFIVLLDEDVLGSGSSSTGGVGERADDVGAAFDLLVHPFQRVRGQI